MAAELPGELWFTTSIAGYPVEVYFVKGLAEARNSFGETRMSRAGYAGPVLLDADLIGTEGLIEILLHEMIHVVEDIYGLRLSEPTVRVLGLGLQQLLKDVFTLDKASLQPSHYVLRSEPAQSESARPTADNLAQTPVPNLDLL